MAQTTLAPDDRAIRPVPRRGAIAPSPARRPRQRLQSQDALWALVVALPVAVIHPLLHYFGYAHAAGVLGLLGVAGCAAAVYMLAWSIAGRPAAVTAGLLLSTSLPFAQQVAAEPATALFGLCTISALALMLFDQPPAALVAAACATAIRADGIILGVILLAACFAQKKPPAVHALVAFLLCAAASVSLRMLASHSALAHFAFGLRSHEFSTIWSGGGAFLLWFLVPLAVDFWEPSRRERWVAIIAWTAVSASAALFCKGGWSDMATLWPLLCVLSACGFARLLPALSGDRMPPGARYAVASLAVTALVGLANRAEFEGLRPFK